MSIMMKHQNATQLHAQRTLNELDPIKSGHISKTKNLIFTKALFVSAMIGSGLLIGIGMVLTLTGIFAPLGGGLMGLGIMAAVSALTGAGLGACFYLMNQKIKSWFGNTGQSHVPSMRVESSKSSVKLPGLSDEQSSYAKTSSVLISSRGTEIKTEDVTNDQISSEPADDVQQYPQPKTAHEELNSQRLDCIDHLYRTLREIQSMKIFSVPVMQQCFEDASKIKRNVNEAADQYAQAFKMKIEEYGASVNQQGSDVNIIQVLDRLIQELDQLLIVIQQQKNPEYLQLEAIEKEQQRRAYAADEKILEFKNNARFGWIASIDDNELQDLAKQAGHDFDGLRRFCDQNNVSVTSSRTNVI